MLCFVRHWASWKKTAGVMALALTAACATSSQVWADAPADPAQRQAVVAQHLQFGEFGRALQIAKGVADPDEKTKLLAQIADAQLKAGETTSAGGSIRLMPNSTQRQRARTNATQRAMAGGAQADFTQLIALIMEETSGGWESDGSGTGTITQFDQGVHVDPTGVLMKSSKEEDAGRLREMGVRARQAALNNDVVRGSELRVISLKRLEQAVSARIAEGKTATESMKLMGGLTKVTHVFLYPQDGDVVLAGQSEGWKYNEAGEPVGVESGRPLLRLDDFVDVLRTFMTNGQRHFSCSINPRPEGLKKLKDFVEKSKAPLAAGRGVTNFVNQAQQQLGRQDIVFTGVDPETRIARVIIEADYRMKLVGIGRYPEAKIPSIFDLMTVEEQKAGRLDALRWWLTMKYDSVLHSPDGTAFEFNGSSVMCLSENQFLNAQGQQVATGQSEGANKLFAEKFTQKYDELSKYDLVFADLKNVFDLALVASLMHNQGGAQKAHFDYGIFGVNGAYSTAKLPAPREVDSVVNHRVYRGRDIVVQVAGGVRADIGAVVSDPKVFQTNTKVTASAQQAQSKSTVPSQRWWWDAK